VEKTNLLILTTALGSVYSGIAVLFPELYYEMRKTEVLRLTTNMIRGIGRVIAGLTIMMDHGTLASLSCKLFGSQKQ